MTGSLAYGLWRGARPKQWLKNVLVAAPAFAAGRIDDRHALSLLGVAFLSMCLVASAAYFFNDVIDAEADRRHPTKQQRPVAAGHVSERAALLTGAVCGIGGLAIAWMTATAFAVAAMIYLVISTAYTVWLKKVPVVDLAVVASFFVFRAVAGGVLLGVPLSAPFVILISSAALFVVAGKRYGDYRSAATVEGDEISGQTLYTLSFLRYIWTMASVSVIAAYCFWAFSEPHVHYKIPWSELSIVPFVLAILRYALVIDSGQAGAPEDVILRDRELQALALAWALTYGAGIYLRG